MHFHWLILTPKELPPTKFYRGLEGERAIIPSSGAECRENENVSRSRRAGLFFAAYLLVCLHSSTAPRKPNRGKPNHKKINQARPRPLSRRVRSHKRRRLKVTQLRRIRLRRTIPRRRPRRTSQLQPSPSLLKLPAKIRLRRQRHHKLHRRSQPLEQFTAS